MAEVAGSEYEVPVDLVLIAAGFLGSQPYVTKAFGLDLTERTNVKTVEGHFKFYEFCLADFAFFIGNEFFYCCLIKNTLMPKVKTLWSSVVVILEMTA